MTTRLAPEQLEMMAEAPQTSLYPYGHFALAFRQAASDATTLAALWREISAMSWNHDCFWCKFCDEFDGTYDRQAQGPFPHAADCLFVRAQQAVKAHDG